MLVSKEIKVVRVVLKHQQLKKTTPNTLPILSSSTLNCNFVKNSTSKIVVLNPIINPPVIQPIIEKELIIIPVIINNTGVHNGIDIFSYQKIEVIKELLKHQ